MFGILIGTVIPLAVLLLVIHALLPKGKRKYLAFAIAAIIFLNYALRLHFVDEFRNVLNGVWQNNKTVWVKRSDLPAAMARWGLNFAIILIPIGLMTKSRVLKIIAVYVGIPCVFLAIGMKDNFMSYFTAADGVGYYAAPVVREWMFNIELFFLLLGGTFLALRDLVYPSKLKELLYILIALPLLALLSCPINVPQSIFGYGKLVFTALSPIGILTYTLMVIAIIACYFVFRNRSQDSKWALVYLLTYTMLVQYSVTNRGTIDLYSLPFQLCNIGVYLTMIAMLFKWQQLFDMLAIVNLQGTIVALIVVNIVEPGGLFSFWQLHYLYEHILLFMIPVIAMSLGLFKFVDKKALRNGVIGFTIYYFFCVILGTIINGMDPLRKVDYFYIFKDTITGNFPLTAFFRNQFVWEIFGHRVYPVFYLLIYLFFGGCCVATYRAIHYYHRVALEHREINALRKEFWRKRYAKNS